MKKFIAIGTFAIGGLVLLATYSFTSTNEASNSDDSKMPPQECKKITTTCPTGGGPAYYCQLKPFGSGLPNCALNQAGECDPLIICR